jgi:hypothetical protein
MKRKPPPWFETRAGARSSPRGLDIIALILKRPPSDLGLPEVGLF